MDTDKLRKALLMALSSGHDGEVLAAVNAIKKQLKAAGYDIHWLADKLSAPDEPDDDDDDDYAYQPADVSHSWRDQLRFLSEDASLALLRSREFDFIMSLGEQRSRTMAWWPTERQEQWLGDIYRRVHAQRRWR